MKTHNWCGHLLPVVIKSKMPFFLTEQVQCNLFSAREQFTVASGSGWTCCCNSNLSDAMLLVNARRAASAWIFSLSQAFGWQREPKWVQKNAAAQGYSTAVFTATTFSCPPKKGGLKNCIHSRSPLALCCWLVFHFLCCSSTLSLCHPSDQELGLISKVIGECVYVFLRVGKRARRPKRKTHQKPTYRTNRPLKR